MKVVKVEDVEKLFEKTGNIMTAYEFSQIEPIELTTNEYEVSVTQICLELFLINPRRIVLRCDLLHVAV